MTDQERVELRNLLEGVPDTRRATLVASGVGGVILACAIVLVIVVGGRAIGVLTSTEVRNLIPYVLPLAVLAAAVLVWPGRQLRSRSDFRRNLDADLREGQVQEESLHFVDVVRFQEPEHGGLIYFLKTSDERVFVLFDHEGQERAVQGGDPWSDALAPQETLVIGRAPRSRILTSRVFSGPQLPLRAPLEMRAPPRDWPETEEFCDIPWTDLKTRFAGG